MAHILREEHLLLVHRWIRKVSLLSRSFEHVDLPGDSEAFATLPLELAEARFDICATWLLSHRECKSSCF